jgi:drug/metabolite transporter (DMT)-like permease
VRGLLARPRLLLVLCALFWAGNFVLGRAMHDSVPPIALAFWRWLTASLLVLPFVWRALRQHWPLLRAHLGRMLLLAVLGVSAFNTLVYVGLQTTTATNSVLIQSSMPIQILLLNSLLFRAGVSAREVFSILLSLSGVLVIIGVGRPWQLLDGWNHGDLWILAAVFVWALYSVLLRWRPPGLEPGAFLGFTLLAGTVVLLPFYLAESSLVRPLVWDLPVALTVAYVAVFPSALAYLFWNRGVAMLGANAAGHYIHLMPVFGSSMAAVFLDERFGWYHGVGAALVAAGIVLSWRGRAAAGPTQ